MPLQTFTDSPGCLVGTVLDVFFSRQTSDVKVVKVYDHISWHWNVWWRCLGWSCAFHGLQSSSNPAEIHVSKRVASIGMFIGSLVRHLRTFPPQQPQQLNSRWLRDLVRWNVGYIAHWNLNGS